MVYSAEMLLKSIKKLRRSWISAIWVTRRSLVGRELGRMSNGELAKELCQELAVLSRGLGSLAEELARNLDLCGRLGKER
jgi:hypothetical protein